LKEAEVEKLRLGRETKELHQRKVKLYSEIDKRWAED